MSLFRNGARHAGIAVAFLLITACANPNHLDMRVVAPGEKLRVACVGDSITWGSGLKNRTSDCYPAQLGKLLGARADVRNFGISGSTALTQGDKPWIGARVSGSNAPAISEVETFRPHAIILALGTNDTKPQNWRYQNDFIQDFAALIYRFRKISPVPRIWICLPPPVTQDRWGINQATLLTQQKRLRELAQQTRTPLIDVYHAFEGQDALMLDGVHPNAEGAAIMAKTIYTGITGQTASP